jgi:signal transduction histidine kinase
LDQYAYDLFTQRTPLPAAPTQSVVVAIDEATFENRGGTRNMRPILTYALQEISNAKPAAVAIDVILHDKGDPEEDAALESALRATPRLILGCELVDGKWEDPLERWKNAAVALGHVQRDVEDAVSRRLPLEQASGMDRRWAMALEAFRVARSAPIIESPDDVEVAGSTIPVPRGSGDRPMFVRYLPTGIPTIPVQDLPSRTAELNGKAVFVGVTATSAVRDRVVDPYGLFVPGVAAHAHAFETMARGDFLLPAGNASVFFFCVLVCAAVGFIFAFLPGWAAYPVTAALLAGVSYFFPIYLFRHGTVFPLVGPAAVAWFSSAGAATYQYFFVRRELVRTESERSRYQRAIHWAAHEMRTPLTAIQGSSEIMTRYKLPEAKQHELSEMINSESKRLSRIIQTFLDVERLAEGQMELKRERMAATEIVDSCLGRVRPIAERKHIDLTLDSDVTGDVSGDRELLEYAFYNLLTNAVKYSAPSTHVRVFSELRGPDLHLAVKDEGMGMDQKELKSIFKKFYRTKRAEASGEVGTGIGLSIVEQIVKVHGGRIDVTSAPGQGSCFTMVLKASASASIQ